MQGGFEQESDLAAARSRANRAARVLGAARQLFAEQGYSGTGISELIEKSGTSKKTFYNYFSSKRDLGEAYLRLEFEALQRRLDRLFSRFKSDYSGFIRAWVRDLKGLAASESFGGCPLSLGAGAAFPDFQSLVADAAEGLLEQLSGYLRSCDLHCDAAVSRRLAGQIMIQYEGALQMWRITGSKEYFDAAAEILIRLPRQWNS